MKDYFNTLPNKLLKKSDDDVKCGEPQLVDLGISRAEQTRIELEKSFGGGMSSATKIGSRKGSGKAATVVTGVHGVSGVRKPGQSNIRVSRENPQEEAANKRKSAIRVLRKVFKKGLEDMVALLEVRRDQSR